MKIKLLLLSIFLSVYIISVYFTKETKNERINIALQEQITTLRTHYDLTMDYFVTDAKSIQENLENNTKVINIFKKAQNASLKQKELLRKELYKKLYPFYARIQSRGILQFQFVFPNNVSFLKMHKPDTYGDKISNIRYSFKEANLNKKTIIGFEQDNTTHAFRYVFPYFDKKGNHLGAIEVSLSSYALQNKLLNVNKIHSHFIVNKNIFEEQLWKTQNLRDKYIQSIEHKDYMYAITQNSDEKSLLENKKIIINSLQSKINEDIKLEKPFAQYIMIKNKVKVISFLPIKDTKNKSTIAYIVSYTDNHNISNIVKDYNSSNFFRFLAMIILFYFTYKNIIHKNELQEEVAEKTKKLKELNENLEEKILIEVDKNKKIHQQLFKSEKLASMGDMIGNIAHQWRQPLSVISTASTGIILQKEFNTLDDNRLKEICTTINENAQYLSTTIDDFRNFIQGDRTQRIFNLKNEIDSFLHLMEGSIKNHNINIILDINENIQINGYENELTQCLINIFNNAKDALIEKNIEEKYIFISTQFTNKKVIIYVKDNAGGIKETIINKIFEPYFTTKHQSQGTGLGLNMTYNLIKDGMDGNIDAGNIKYSYQNKMYKGALLTITLPLNMKKENDGL